MKIQNSQRFSENDIRPKHLADGQQVAMTIDIGRLLIHADQFTYVTCPACDGNSSVMKFRKYGFTFEQCRSCETIYTNPRPTEKVLEEFYKNSANYDYWNRHIFPASEDARRQKIFVPRVNRTLDLCEKYKVATDSLLEIGAAFGTFCIELMSRNVFSTVVAVEPTPGLAKSLRDRGVKVIEDVIENIDFAENEKYDVVANFEVLEHLFSPKDFVRHCRKCLKPGGLLILTCPNGKGFDFQILQEKCNSLDHEHLNYFNPTSLTTLLENNGFSVLETLTPGRLDAELVRNKVLSGEFEINNQPFLKNILVDQWEEKGQIFQEFLIEAGLSSNLWIVARVKSD